MGRSFSSSMASHYSERKPSALPYSSFPLSVSRGLLRRCLKGRSHSDLWILHKGIAPRSLIHSKQTLFFRPNMPHHISSLLSKITHHRSSTPLLDPTPAVSSINDDSPTRVTTAYDNSPTTETTDDDDSPTPVSTGDDDSPTPESTESSIKFVDEVQGLHSDTAQEHAHVIDLSSLPDSYATPGAECNIQIQDAVVTLLEKGGYLAEFLDPSVTEFKLIQKKKDDSPFNMHIVVWRRGAEVVVSIRHVYALRSLLHGLRTSQVGQFDNFDGNAKREFLWHCVVYCEIEQDKSKRFDKAYPPNLLRPLNLRGAWSINLVTLRRIVTHDIQRIWITRPGPGPVAFNKKAYDIGLSLPCHDKPISADAVEPVGALIKFMLTDGCKEESGYCMWRFTLTTVRFSDNCRWGYSLSTVRIRETPPEPKKDRIEFDDWVTKYGKRDQVRAFLKRNNWLDVW